MHNMKLINEAAGDDQFNAELDKIQQAIIKLEKLMKTDFVPVQSQVNAIKTAEADLDKLAETMTAKRK